MVTIEYDIVKWEIPQRALKMIFEWLEIQKEELRTDGELAQLRSPLRRIESLK